MVTGLDKFKEHFAGFEGHYVLIGGTAATLAMEDAGLTFRATKDLDIVLVIEVLDEAFGLRLWEFIQAGQYQIRQSGDGRPNLYRFSNPQASEYPYMLELFSRRLDGLVLSEEAELTPIPLEDAVSSLSAILLDDDYYSFVIRGRRQEDGLSWIDFDRLIPLKASAWLDMTERVNGGESIDSKKIAKHMKDVFRLSQLLSAESRIELPARVYAQLSEFLDRAAEQSVDLKALEIATSKQEVIERIRKAYVV